jgi:hypothetical protein
VRVQLLVDPFNHRFRGAVDLLQVCRLWVWEVSRRLPAIRSACRVQWAARTPDGAAGRCRSSGWLRSLTRSPELAGALFQDDRRVEPKFQGPRPPKWGRQAKEARPSPGTHPPARVSGQGSGLSRRQRLRIQQTLQRCTSSAPAIHGVRAAVEPILSGSGRRPYIDLRFDQYRCRCQATAAG